jgi:hypothetical protein
MIQFAMVARAGSFPLKSPSPLKASPFLAFENKRIGESLSLPDGNVM